MAGIAAISPYTITIPRLAPVIPAAAMGPGVGGTMVWVAYRPVARAIAMTAIELPDSLAKALFNGVKITYPESQNTGMETTYPAILMSQG